MNSKESSKKLKHSLLYNIRVGGCFVLITLATTNALAKNDSRDGLGVEANNNFISVSKDIISLKQNFIKQDLPAPKVTGSLEQKIQSEDEALISAIISQDLKGQRGQ